MYSKPKKLTNSMMSRTIVPDSGHEFSSMAKGLDNIISGHWDVLTTEIHLWKTEGEWFGFDVVNPERLRVNGDLEAMIGHTLFELGAGHPVPTRSL